MLVFTAVVCIEANLNPDAGAHSLDISDIVSVSDKCTCVSHLNMVKIQDSPFYLKQYGII